VANDDTPLSPNSVHDNYSAFDRALPVIPQLPLSEQIDASSQPPVAQFSEEHELHASYLSASDLDMTADDGSGSISTTSVQQATPRSFISITSDPRVIATAATHPLPDGGNHGYDMTDRTSTSAETSTETPAWVIPAVPYPKLHKRASDADQLSASDLALTENGASIASRRTSASETADAELAALEDTKIDLSDED